MRIAMDAKRQKSMNRYRATLEAQAKIGNALRLLAEAADAVRPYAGRVSHLHRFRVAERALAHAKGKLIYRPPFLTESEP